MQSKSFGLRHSAAVWLLFHQVSVFTMILEQFSAQPSQPAKSSFAKKNALQIRTPDRTPDRPYVAVKMQGFETCSRLAYARRSLFAQTSVFTIPNEPPLTSRQI